MPGRTCACTRYVRYKVDNSARSFIDIYASRPVQSNVRWRCWLWLSGHRAPIMCARARVHRSVNISPSDRSVADGSGDHGGDGDAIVSVRSACACDRSLPSARISRVHNIRACICSLVPSGVNDILHSSAIDACGPQVDTNTQQGTRARAFSDRMQCT